MIHPIQSFNEASAPKKAAIVAGAVATAAGVGSLVYAAKTGKAGQAIADVFKKTGENETVKSKLGKVVSAFGEGYKNLGDKLVSLGKKAEPAINAVKEKASEVAKNVQAKASEVKTAVTHKASNKV